ncbi:MAG: YggS family pyridoxal phosphate-dependent enzyme, partial [Planctomycetes bacterium]|nr:YggS family pyridoxal phosphate-dependent enzyme [Planctomycetota bacterium]
MSPDQVDRLRRNVDEVRGRIARAAERVGRPAAEVALLPVTKSVPAPVAAALLELGMTHLAENRVPDCLAKMDALAAPARWHFVGRMQGRKVKVIAGRFDVVHSVESPARARDLAAHATTARAAGRPPLEVYLQVNVSGEAAKQGMSPDEARLHAGEIAALPSLRVVGLMTMAPAGGGESAARASFAALRALSLRLAEEAPGWRGRCGLSMGMSADYEIAVEEGATVVRVGGVLFEG